MASLSRDHSACSGVRHRSVSSHQQQDLEDVRALSPLTIIDTPRLVPMQNSLSPDGVWFNSASVVHTIYAAIRSSYWGPYTCWRKTPKEIKTFWWLVFRDRYTCAEEHSALFRNEFKLKASRCLRKLVFNATIAHHDEEINWMSKDIRKALKVRRNLDEFKKKSAHNCSKNLITGSKPGSLHSQGSISSSEFARHMEKHEPVKDACQVEDGMPASQGGFREVVEGQSPARALNEGYTHIRIPPTKVASTGFSSAHSVVYALENTQNDSKEMEVEVDDERVKCMMERLDHVDEEYCKVNDLIANLHSKMDNFKVMIHPSSH